MHSVLACRMLLELHEYGKITVHGDDFRDYTSNSPQGQIVFRSAIRGGH